jgi:hypothetical protein
VSWEPVLGQPGIEALSPFIASAVGRWSAIEAQLDTLFILITQNDPAERESFHALKGWDRRAVAIAEVAEARHETVDADRVKTVLRLTSVPAGKRHELAHSTWAILEGCEDRLVLLPRDFNVHYGMNLSAAAEAGTGSIPVTTLSMVEAGCLVARSHLEALIAELQRAQEILDALLFGHFLNPALDPAGDGYESYRRILAEDPEVTERMANMARERRRSARSRGTSQA